MQYLGWFILGLAISRVNVLSLTRTITGLHDKSSMRTVWMSYTFRFVFTGLGLLLALQWGALQAITVFLGILVFRWALLLPGFRRFFIIF